MQRRGISLVALVITIIVLIILTAGVIMLAGGENGIIGRAQRTVEANNQATATEKVLLEVSNIKMEVAGTGQTVSQYLYDTAVEGDTTKGAIRRAELEGKGISISVTPPTEQELVFTVGDYLVTTDLNGNILSTNIIQPQESNVMVVASTNGTGTALGAGTQTSGATIYISFEANLEGGTITSVTYNNTSPVTTITAQGNKYVQQITSNGTYSFTINGTVGENATSKTFTVTVNQYIGDALNAYRYGDTINYGVNIDSTEGNTEEEQHINGWKIFYEDSDYMYIIAGDYLANSELPNTSSELPNGLNMSTHTNYPYSAYWGNSRNFTSVDSSDIDARKARQFGLSWLLNNGRSTNDNAKATADLFHQAWTDKFGGGIVGLECTAIGGPTIEMYVKSWNAKGYTTLYCNKSNSTGYYVGNTTSPSTVGISMISDVGYNDTLYYPHQADFGNCYAYWLASPSAYYAGAVMHVSDRGDVSNGGSYDLGVRPVVSLPKSGIQVSGAGAGVWNVSKQ